MARNDVAKVNENFITALQTTLADKESKGFLSFPQGYDYHSEMFDAYLTLKQTSNKQGLSVLDTCDKVSITNTLFDMVRNGLSMNRGQCYAIDYKGQLQLQISVFGYEAIARRKGLVSNPTQIIYKNDVFKYHIEEGEIVIDEHTQDFENIDNDNIIGAYSIAVMSDGFKHTELMTLAQMRQAWRQGYGYKENDKTTTHAKFTDQMCKKTVKKRCLKEIVRAYTDEGIDFEDNTDTNRAEDIVAERDMDVENANSVDFTEIVTEAKTETAPEVQEAEVEVLESDEMPPFAI